MFVRYVPYPDYRIVQSWSFVKSNRACNSNAMCDFVATLGSLLPTGQNERICLIHCRKPSALVFNLCNFRSLDTSHASKGFSSSSKLSNGYGLHSRTNPTNWLLHRGVLRGMYRWAAFRLALLSSCYFQCCLSGIRDTDMLTVRNPVFRISTGNSDTCCFMATPTRLRLP